MIEFKGEFDFNQVLDHKLCLALLHFNDFGSLLDIEYHFDDVIFVKNQQPSGKCRWVPTADRRSLRWDCGNQFDYFYEWLEYLIKYIFKPRNIVLNGAVKFYSNIDDQVYGNLIVCDNCIQMFNFKNYFELYKKSLQMTNYWV
jgi:hypothetical protein